MPYAVAGKHSACVGYRESVLLCLVVNNEAEVIQPRAPT